MKYFDMFGNEFKVGDFVAYATKCTSSAKLRRGLVTEMINKSDYGNRLRIGIRLKSIIPDIDVRKWGYVTVDGKCEYQKLPPHDYVGIGNCTRLKWYENQEIPDSIQFPEIIFLNSDYTKVFSEREQQALITCKTKLIP